MLDATGFKRKTYADLFAEMEVKARELFGANVNTSALTPLGIILRIFAWFLSFAWQDSEDVYYSAFKNTAEGNNLDRIMPNVGMTRLLEQAATGSISITGTANYTVPEGFRLATATDVFFETLEPVQLDVNGAGTVPIIAVSPGRSGNVAANTITIVVNPDANVTSVTNAEPTSGGREKETDQEARERWDLSVAGGGGGTTDSIRSELLRTPDVRAAVVIENYTNAPDSDGRPPKSISAYVLGGTPEDIGKAIFAKRSGGIEPFGTESVTVNDIGGHPHIMKFSYAQEVDVHVKATITTNSSFPSDGDQQVESAIVRYIGGEDSDGQLYVGLNMGEDVIHSRLIAAVYKVAGIEDVTLELSTDGTTWSQANVAVTPQQVAQTTHTTIQVVHAP